MKKTVAIIVLISLLLTPLVLLAETTIIDNSDSAFSTTGNWKSADMSFLSSSFHGEDYLRSKNKHAVATWDTSSSSGEYEIFVMYASVFLYARNAVYQVHHANGITTVSLDHSRNGGLWQSIGTFSDPDQIVLSSDNSDGAVSADAIKLVKIEEEEEEEPVVCPPSNGGGSGGHFSSKKAYFAGTHSYRHPASAYYCRSRMFIANVTNEPIEVTMSVFDSSGNIILDDGNASSGRFRIQTSTPTEYTDDGPIVFTLSPKQSLQLTMYEGASGSEDYEHGEITWNSLTEGSSEKVAILANGSVYCDEYGSGTKQAWREVSINAGLPF